MLLDAQLEFTRCKLCAHRWESAKFRNVLLHLRVCTVYITILFGNYLMFTWGYTLSVSGNAPTCQRRRVIGQFDTGVQQANILKRLF